MNKYLVEYYTLSDGRGHKEIKALTPDAAEMIAKKADPSFDTFARVDVILLESDLTFCVRCNDYIGKKEMRVTLADDDTYRFICPGCDVELLPPKPFDGLRL